VRDLAISVIDYALSWLDNADATLPASLLADLAAAKFRPGQSLAQIEVEYQNRLEQTMTEYSQSEAAITRFRNAFRRTVSDGFNSAALVGWVDGGGQGGLPEVLQLWVNARIDSEIAFSDDLFRQLRDMRKAGDQDAMATWIQARARGYTQALPSVNGYAVTIAEPNRPGKWEYGDTIDHCATDNAKGTMGCSDLVGQTHPLSYWREKGLIPQQPGNRKITCGGWRCQCRIVDPETGKTLLPTA
jgi:hypothetical protein